MNWSFSELSKLSSSTPLFAGSSRRGKRIGLRQVEP